MNKYRTGVVRTVCTVLGFEFNFLLVIVLDQLLGEQDMDAVDEGGDVLTAAAGREEGLVCERRTEEIAKACSAIVVVARNSSEIVIRFVLLAGNTSTINSRCS
jgi:hypothetical protein